MSPRAVRQLSRHSFKARLCCTVFRSLNVLCSALRFHTSLSLIRNMSSSKQNPIMDALTTALRSGPAQRRKDDFYRPNQVWISPASSHNPSASPIASINPKNIRVISWNIDMLVPFGNERMTAALQYLEGLMTHSDLDLIKSSQWIQDQFAITDKDRSSWLTPHYGTTTLIDARLDIANVFRVPVLSKFDRDGLFVDIAVSKHPAPAEATAKVLRLCNVHLESLIANPPVRPHQLSALATYLHAPEVACALLAGDLNAIEPFDRTLHTDHRLEDAYLSLGGKEGSDEGYTWGYQVPSAMREKFGCSRMDKRIGAGVKVAENMREEVRQAGEEEWVSDHYGVMGDFEISGDWSLRTDGSGEELKSKLS
ncbi:hypothetical protein SVAN01_02938 [Stagonosporopsis vannaccii]|nr:hypothetical protein SVAN01_02938 [Stagonosporopsis vannaccii]